MPTMKLTERTVARLPAPDPSGKQVLWWDEELRGFGVLCSGTTTSKSYVVQRNVGSKNRRVTIAAVGETTLKDARDAGASTLLDMRRGVDPKAKTTNATLGQALDAYLTAGTRLRGRTAETYRRLVHLHLADWINIPLRDITADVIASRHRRIAESVSTTSGQKGEAVANLVMKVFRAVWNFTAESDPTLPPCPTRALRRQWFNVPRRVRCVRSEDLPRFVSAVRALQNTIHRDYLLLLLFTGMRRREAASLTWDDVDFAPGVLRVPATVTKSGRKLDLPMTDLVRDVLLARRSVGREAFVFSGDSRSGHLEDCRDAFASIFNTTGIKVSPHDLRRTYVTVAESADISPIALRCLISHSLGADVTSGYIQMSVERLREPAQRVADRLRILITNA